MSRSIFLCSWKSAKNLLCLVIIEALLCESPDLVDVFWYKRKDIYRFWSVVIFSRISLIWSRFWKVFVPCVHFNQSSIEVWREKTVFTPKILANQIWLVHIDGHYLNTGFLRCFSSRWTSRRFFEIVSEQILHLARRPKNKIKTI